MVSGVRLAPASGHAGHCPPLEHPGAQLVAGWPLQSRHLGLRQVPEQGLCHQLQLGRCGRHTQSSPDRPRKLRPWGRFWRVARSSSRPAPLTSGLADRSSETSEGQRGRHLRQGRSLGVSFRHEGKLPQVNPRLGMHQTLLRATEGGGHGAVALAWAMAHGWQERTQQRDVRARGRQVVRPQPPQV